MDQSTTIDISEKNLPSEDRGAITKTVCYYISFFAFGLVTGVFGPTLPRLAENTHTRIGDIGFLFMARSLGYVLGSYLSGKLYDRLPGHLILLSVLVTLGGMMVLVPVIPLLWLLMVILLVLGITEGSLDVGGNILLLWVHGAKVGPYINGLHFFLGVGAFLSPIIVAQVVMVSGDITWAYWLLAFITLTVIPWLLRLPSPKAQSTSKEAQQGKIDTIPIVLIMLLFAAYVGAEMGFGDWIYTYTITQQLSAEATAAYMTSAFWGALTLGRLLGVPLSTRFSPRVLLLVDLFGSLISVSIFLLWPGSLVACWSGTIGLGLSMASVFAMILAFAGREMKITGGITGWFFVGVGLGGMSLPWLIGRLLEFCGPRFMMLAILLDLALALVAFWGLNFFYTFSKNSKASS